MTTFQVICNNNTTSFGPKGHVHARNLVLIIYTNENEIAITQRIEHMVVFEFSSIVNVTSCDTDS